MTALAIKDVQHTYYIGIGAHDIFYTFRKQVFSKYGLNNDVHICNLSTNLDEAQRKAEEYVEQIKNRLNIKVELITDIESETWQKPQHLAKIPAHIIYKLEAIENGIVPFGKHNGSKIVDLPESYILWMADKNADMGDDNETLPFKSLSNACLGICLERGLFEVRKEKNELRQFYGEIGQRKVMTALIKSGVRRNHRDYGIQYSYILEIDGCRVKYFGSVNLGYENEVVSMKATISDHLVDSQTHEKTTVIKRPSSVKTISEENDPD